MTDGDCRRASSASRPPRLLPPSSRTASVSAPPYRSMLGEQPLAVDVN
jgi:hypothetical protein